MFKNLLKKILKNILMEISFLAIIFCFLSFSTQAQLRIDVESGLIFSQKNDVHSMQMDKSQMELSELNTNTNYTIQMM